LARYRKKDLKFARLHVVRAEQSISRQEVIMRRLRRISGPLDVEHALLGRLHDSQRRVLYRLKRIEDFLGVRSQPA
jgi:hypothetical protein